jgi:hypothetical protein
MMAKLVKGRVKVLLSRVQRTLHRGLNQSLLKPKVHLNKLKIKSKKVLLKSIRRRLKMLPLNPKVPDCQKCKKKPKMRQNLSDKRNLNLLKKMKDKRLQLD